MRSRRPTPRANEATVLPGFTACRLLNEDAVAARYHAHRGDEEMLVEVLVAGQVTDGVRERLRRQANAIRALESPQVLPCIDIDVAAGRTVLVYPWPGEGTLADDCAPGVAPDPAAGIALVTEVVRGLEAIHRQGLVHGGLTPGRVHCGRDQVRLGGLGLALAQVPERIFTEAVCLAPEIILGTGLDGRADLHAAGVMLWRLCVGAWPWTVADRADLDVWARSPRPEVPAGLPPHLDLVLAKAMARDRDDRYAIAQHLREDLERIAHGFTPLHARSGTGRVLRQPGSVTVHRLPVPAPARPIPPAEPAVPVSLPLARRWPVVVGGLGAVVGILVVLAWPTTAPPAVPAPVFATPVVPVAPVRPSWATTAGQDAAGVWAEALVGGLPLRLRLIPAGTFTRGSPLDEPDRRVDETVGQVTISRPFWLAETELTQSLYRVTVGANPSRHQGNDLPVENLTWDEAAAACARLAVLIPGLAARLPSEAEWEYACRAGTGGSFALAAEPGLRAWDERSSGGAPNPVGRLRANAWGLFDLHGNVLEWTADAYGPYPSGPVTDPRLPNGVQRSARGGAWSMAPGEARSAARFHFMPRAHLPWLGLRIAADG
jgi:sulfatase modifying factor 1